MKHIIGKVRYSLYKYLVDHYPRAIIDRRWKRKFARSIDWKHPRDINEKIQWLICYGDTSQWPRLADKYTVREFVAEKGYGNLLTELYGVWDDAGKIDFDALPEKFVLKCTHDSASYHIVDKKKGFDKELLVSDLNYHLSIKYGYLSCEPHYNRIKPRIIAEEYLHSSTDSSFSSSLIDYKVWCFGGSPFCICVYYGRDKSGAYINVYDLNWNVHPEYSVFTKHYRDGKGLVSKPDNLQDMLKAASILSQGLPQARIDFYIVDGKIYFGEITLTSHAGRMDNYTDEFLIKMGDQVDLPK